MGNPEPMTDDARAELLRILDPVNSEWELHLDDMRGTLDKLRTEVHDANYGTARQLLDVLEDDARWLTGSVAEVTGHLDTLTR